MNLTRFLIKLAGGSGSGNFGHSGRFGKVGGSGPTLNSTASNYMRLVNQLGDELSIDDVREWNSLGFDGQMDLFHDNKEKFEKLKSLSDQFRSYKVPVDHPITEHLGVGQAKEILNRMAQPPLSDRELSKLPNKDNYKAWFYQKYGIVADDLSGENAKRYGEALDDIAKKHGVVGGFFLSGVDRAWQLQGEKGGEWDSAYSSMKVPTRLPKGGHSQDAKDVLSHEYAHYLDSHVLGKPNVTNTRVRGAVVNRKDDRTGWLTIRQAESMGFSKEPREGYTQYTAGGKATSWYRDTSRVQRIGYKDWTPHEQIAKMFEDHMAGRSFNHDYSKSETDWFNSEVLSRL